MNIMTGQPSFVTSPRGNNVSNNSAYKIGTRLDGTTGRVTLSYISGYVSLDYEYNNGRLAKLSRGGYNNVGAANKEYQHYCFSYDEWGNRIASVIGPNVTAGIHLADYTYYDNGNLCSEEYGNGYTVNYGYDIYGRQNSKTSSTRDVRYYYNGNGSLYKLTDTVGSNTTTEIYKYDSINRLIGTQKSNSVLGTLSTWNVYDDYNRVTKYSYSLPSILGNASQQYEYEPSTTGAYPQGTLTSMSMVSGNDIGYTYDALLRLESRDIAGIFNENYEYYDVDSSKTSSLVNCYSCSSEDTTYLEQCITYDLNGNIHSIGGSGNTETYTYDNQNQLTRVVTNNKTYNYSYNTYGNILSASDGSTTKEFKYTDPIWRDKLTSIKIGNTEYPFSYDTIGNPTTYNNGRGYNFTWTEGKKLASANVNGANIYYAYDSNGYRTSKSTNNGTVYYVWDGSILLGEYKNTANGSLVYAIRYIYDENTSPIGLQYSTTGNNWATYYYVKNNQGDVIYIVNSSGTIVGSYSYDPWGKVLHTSNLHGGTIAGINSIRYRGYYYDNETGFYYLQSRYYDPANCRFINADCFASTGQGFLGLNSFVYCLNNPVFRLDHNGEYSFLCREEDCVPRANSQNRPRKTEMTLNNTSITIVLGDDLAMATFVSANIASYFIGANATFKGIKEVIKISKDASDIRALLNATKALELLESEGYSAVSTSSSLVELCSTYENNGFVVVEFYIPQSATEWGEFLFNGMWRIVNDG